MNNLQESAAIQSLDFVVPGLGTSINAVKMLGGGGFSTGRTARKKAKQAYKNYTNQYNNALTNLQNTTNSAIAGGDNSDLLDAYRQYLNDTYNAKGKGFRGDTASQLIGGFVNKETDKRKNELQSWLNNTYGGFGTTNAYLDNYWKTDADNDFNTQFLDDYYNQSMSQLETAKNRGLLNDAGYNSAMSALDRRKSAATGELNTMTDDVINNYRDDLANKVTGFQTAIDDYSLGQRNNYNTTSFGNQFNDLYGTQQDNLETDLNNAVSGYTPFDVSDILGSARNTQGVLTGGNQNSELLQSLQDQKKAQTNKVGLGNQGIF